MLNGLDYDIDTSVLVLQMLLCRLTKQVFTSSKRRIVLQQVSYSKYAQILCDRFGSAVINTK